MHENRRKRFAASLSVRPIGSLVDLWPEPVNESGIAGMICVWQNVCFDGKAWILVSILDDTDFTDDLDDMYCAVSERMLWHVSYDPGHYCESISLLLL